VEDTAYDKQENEMSNKSMHPENELFEYLNHSLAEEHSSAIEAHLATCEECASVAAAVRALKADGALNNSQLQIGDHPGINELASFFYSKEESSNIAQVANHVAICSSCAEAIAQYASSERASELYEPPRATPGEVPAEAWKMIDEWENSSFGKLKPANEVLGQELLDRLAELLNERVSRGAEIGSFETKTADRVPVLVVNSSGEVRGVEFFDHETDKTGASILRHSEGSERFDKKPIHALFSFGEKQPLVVSTVMNRNTVRLEQARPGGEARRADYFIIED